MLKTKLCDLAGIKYPIFQGGMAWAATAELAAAVSAAGGLGIIGAGHAPAEVVREEIKKVKAVTDKPFGVNLMYLSPHLEAVVDTVIKERVPVVTTGAGNPGKHIQRYKEAGIKVFPVVSSVALAKRLARNGVDGLIAEGMESGGHIGDITTMALVPQIVDAVTIPVIAAGGIGDGRGLVAALALGAVGVQMGTRFVCASECIAHNKYKQAIVKAKDRDTTVTGASGHYVRAIRNKLSREYENLAAQGVPLEELLKLGEGKLRQAVIEGDVDYGTVMAGQISALVSKVQPAAEILEEIMTGAEKVLKGLDSVISQP